MSRIPVYNNTLAPDPQPLVNAARNAENKARTLGMIVEKGWNQLGAGVEAAQKGLMQDDKQAGREEVTNLTASVAEMTADMTGKWNDTLASSDPGDGSVASKFMDEEWHKNWDGLQAQTSEGQQYLTKAMASSYKHFSLMTHSNQAASLAANAVNQAGNIYTQYSNSIADNPTNWKTVMSQSDDALDALDGVHGGAVGKEKLKEKYNHEYAMTAARTMLQTDPDTATQLLNSGEFSSHMSGLDRDNLLHAAGVQKKALDQQNLIANKQADLARKNEAEGALGHLRQTVPMSPDGSYFQIPGDYGQHILELGKKYGDVPGFDRKINIERNWMATQTRTALGEMAKVRTPDYDLMDSFYKRLNDGTLTKEDLKQAAIDHKITPGKFNEFDRAINKPQSDRSAQVSARRYLTGFKGLIEASAPGFETSIGRSRYQEYETDMMASRESALASGQTEKQWEETSRGNVQKYLMKPQELTNVLKGGNLSLPEEVDTGAPATAPPAAGAPAPTDKGSKPTPELNESPHDFLQRLNKWRSG